MKIEFIGKNFPFLRFPCHVLQHENIFAFFCYVNFFFLNNLNKNVSVGVGVLTVTKELTAQPDVYGEPKYYFVLTDND